MRLFCGQLTLEPPSWASLESNSPKNNPRPGPFGMSGFGFCASHLHGKSYVLAVMKLKLLSGACVRDCFSLESSYLEYEVLVIAT